MKTLKPQRLGLLHRTFENGDDCFLCVAILMFVRLDNGGLLPESAMWKFAAEALGKDAAIDEVMPKQRGEILIDGSAYPPGGSAVSTMVRARLGAIDKSIRVVGDRRWRGGAMSVPEPFDEMPLSWSRAFGGEGFASNPAGRGFAPVRSEAGELHPLPNLESPDAPITAIGDRPAPVSFGGFDITSPQRMAKFGTYDDRWLKTRFPGFAADMDWSIFNVTAPDQQIDGYFRGSEGFVLENMHPTKPTLHGRLPGYVARCFITRESEGLLERVELTTRLDTVRLFPAAERAILIYRAVARVAEDDAADVQNILLACEREGEPRSVEHYQDALRRRLDREVSHLYLLRDDELLPPPPPDAPPPEKTEIDEHIATEGLLQANLRRRYEAEQRRMREHFIAQGLEPPEAQLPPLAIDGTPPSLEELLPLFERISAEIDAKRREADEGRAKAEARAQAVREEHGVEMGEPPPPGGPPRFSAREERARLRGIRATAEAHNAPTDKMDDPDDPAVVKRLEEAEAKIREAYRQFAHDMPEAPRRWGFESQVTRDAVAAAVLERRSLAGADLTGVDLSDMDLRGADLRGAFLECVRFESARLDGADLTGAVLARAELSGANLTSARLVDANLGGARLRGATLDGADLTGANLTRADLEGAMGRGVTLTRARMTEVRLAGAKLPALNGAELIFMHVDLSGLDLSGADLTKCTFLESPVTGADFQGANLTSAVFLKARGDGANFRGARLTNLRVVEESSLRGVEMIECNLDGANLRGADLSDANLSNASLVGADLSGCDLTRAKLYRVSARECRMVRANLTDALLISANLMLAVLQKARLTGADFTGANLFRADLAKVRGRPKSVSDALLTEARVVTRGSE
jgi:uncharacterized protein YjbI with pentapeptide repeats